MPDGLKKFGEEIEERRQIADRREEGWHVELKKELTAYAERIEGRLRKFYSRALGAFAIIGIASAVALVGFGIVLDAQKSTTETIQNQRYESLLQNCLDTNVRHDNVVKKIRTAETKVPKAKRDPRGLALFQGILEAAVPYTSDCRSFARDRLRGG